VPDVQRVEATHKKRRRLKDALPSSDEVISAYPKTRLEIILDNLNTHEKNEAWLADDHCQPNTCGPMMP
jgi:hypothetical protein